MEEYWLPMLWKGLTELYGVFYERSRRNKDEEKKKLMIEINKNRSILLPITKVPEENITDEKLDIVINDLLIDNLESILENDYNFNKFFKLKNSAKSRKFEAILEKILEKIRSLNNAPIINKKEEIKELIELIIKLGKLLKS